MLLADVIQRDTRANQPAATAVADGTLYYVTDESVTERSNGTTWQDCSDGGGAVVQTHVIGIVLDGGGSDITTGVKGFISCPFTGTIVRVTMLSIDSAATAGDLVVDIWVDSYANYPPTNADSITAGNEPEFTADAKYDDATLSGWDVGLTAGDVVGFNVDSCSGVTKAIVQLTVEV